MTKELEGLEEGLKAEIHIYLVKTTLKNIKLENTIEYMVSGSRNSPPFLTD